MKRHLQALARWARHIWLDADDARRTITPEGLQRLEQAVRHSEARHLGELRLCIEAGLPASSLWRGVTSRQRAVDLFGRLRVWDTEHNNGVLIYLLLADHRIEILADRGLHRHAPDAVWRDIADRLAGTLREGRFEAGLAQAVREVEALLRQHFPPGAGHANPNELPDAVVLM